MSFAKVTIVGNLGQDPESRYLQSGSLVVSFSIAASGRRRSGDNQANTTWFRVSAFDRLAESLANMVEKGYIAKGRTLYVEGQLETRQYQGNDGQMRTSLDVTMTDWKFVGGNQQNDQQGGSNQGNYGGGQNDYNQSGSSYGGSNYGNEFPSGDDQTDMNDVPF